jgi:NitT/TauT family transport system ATP-binding protein
MNDGIKSAVRVVEAAVSERHSTAAGVTSKVGKLVFEGVSLSYRSVNGSSSTVLDKLDLVVNGGEFVSVVGPSGCGKSSALMIAAGLLTPTAGKVLLGDVLLEGPRPDLIGIVFQESSLMPWRTAIENVAFPLQLRSVPLRERTDRAQACLDLVGLSDARSKYPHELSGGMRQRVSIARGLVQEPQLLLMDEPFGALDEQNRVRMGEELLRIWDRVRSTVVFVTHSLSEALYLSDRVIMLGGRPGKIILEKTMPFSRPRDGEIIGTSEFGEIRNEFWRLLKH